MYVLYRALVIIMLGMIICRNNMTQTKQDIGINIPQPSTFIAGLRGKDITPRNVDLTLPVE